MNDQWRFRQNITESHWENLERKHRCRRSCRIWDQYSAITDDDHPNLPPTPSGAKTASKLFQNENLNIKISNVWIHLKMEISQLLTINQTAKKIPEKNNWNSSRKLSEKSSQISGFPIISFLLDGDASPPSTSRGPKTASIRGKLFILES